MEDSSITEKTESLLEKFRRVKRELQLLREYKRNVPWYEKEHYQTFKITPVKAVLMYRGKHLEGIFKIQVLSLDVPAREVNCLLFTETGTKELIIRTFSDSLMLKVLELYNKGKDVLHVKIDSGVINQVFDEEELARKREKLQEETSKIEEQVEKKLKPLILNTADKIQVENAINKSKLRLLRRLEKEESLALGIAKHLGQNDLEASTIIYHPNGEAYLQIPIKGELKEKLQELRATTQRGVG